ncbi:hypothetical protein Tco_1357583 [Tanacetum coccineum]
MIGEGSEGCGVHGRNYGGRGFGKEGGDVTLELLLLGDALILGFLMVHGDWISYLVPFVAVASCVKFRWQRETEISGVELDMI